MALTPHQKEILQFVGTREVTAKEIVNRFKGMYYANGRKHVYDRIARLYKSNWLVKVSRGVYRVGTGQKTVIEDKSQLKLF